MVPACWLHNMWSSEKVSVRDVVIIWCAEGGGMMCDPMRSYNLDHRSHGVGLERYIDSVLTSVKKKPETGYLSFGYDFLGVVRSAFASVIVVACAPARGVKIYCHLSAVDLIVRTFQVMGGRVQIVMPALLVVHTCVSFESYSVSHGSSIQ